MIDVFVYFTLFGLFLLHLMKRNRDSMRRSVWALVRRCASSKPSKYDAYVSTLARTKLRAVIHSTDQSGRFVIHVVESLYGMSELHQHTVTRTFQEFLDLHRSLSVDLRFVIAPSHQVESLNNFLTFLCVRHLSAADCTLRSKFLQLRSLTETSSQTEMQASSDEVSTEGESAREIADGGAVTSTAFRRCSSDFTATDSVYAHHDSFIIPDVSVPENVSVIYDIPYCDAPHPKHHLDIYCPRGNIGAKLPVVFHIHGGGWIRGDRKIPFYGSPPMCIGYAQNGFIAVAPSYRLGRAPDHVDDCKQALEWVFKNIQKFGGDACCVFLSGHSAGANIACLLSTLFSVRGVISVSGVYNLERPFDSPWKNQMFATSYLRRTFGTQLDTWREHSPLCTLSRVLESNSADVSSYNGVLSDTLSGVCGVKFPPFFVLSAAWDLGLEVDAVRFVTRLAHHGVEVHYDRIGRTNHASINWACETHTKLSRWMQTLT